MGNLDLMTLVILGIGLVVVLLVIGLIVSIRRNKSEVDERLDKYLGEEQEVVEVKKRSSGMLTEWLNRSVAKSTFGERLAKDLARADLKFKPGEYIAFTIIIAFLVGGILWYVAKQSLIAALIGIIIGAFLPRLYVKRAQSKRLVKFNEQLPDMLNLMVNGLRAGYSTMQALEAVSKELPAPICDEFKRVVQEMQLGISQDKALDNLVRRIPSDDLDLCVTAINVQREVGGNLAEILDTISYTIRERVRIKGEINVLTGQQKLSGTIMTLMPVAVIIILYLINPEYMGQFFLKETNSPFPCGICALVAVGTLLITGYFAMRKMGQVEV